MRFSLGGRTFSFCFGFCLALEGFCIFSSPRMDRFLVFSTTDFFRSVSRHGCISSLYVRVCLSPSPSPPSLSPTPQRCQKPPTSYCVTGICQPLGSFLLSPKTVWSLRGVMHNVHTQRWGGDPPREGGGWLFLPCPSSFSFPFGGPGSGFHSDLYPLTW